MSKIINTGGESREKLLNGVNQLADAVVSASIEPEAFGRVAVEAQAMSKPIIASNIEVDPTFKNVAVSLIFASPQITCRRRYFVASACGSSLVFMMGRFRVVSKPTSSSKKSAR